MTKVINLKNASMSLSEFYQALDALKNMQVITHYHLRNLHEVEVKVDSVRGEMLLAEFCKEMETVAHRPKGKKNNDY